MLLIAGLAAGLLAPSAQATKLTPVGTFSSPVYVTAPPGDNSRLFVVEQGGTIRVIKDGVTLSNPFLDITSRVLSGGERGLLSMAFAPDYATSGRFYVYYTNRPNGDIEVDEYQRSNNPDVAGGPTKQPLFTISHSEFANHNGGQLQFGPDGLLYAGTGDGGSGGDPHGNAQNPSSLLGKLLRIDPSSASATPQVFALGLRNPWRFSFDRQTHDLIIGDVGQGREEEIDFAAAPGMGQGANYGWNRYEGDLTYPDGNPASAFPSGVVGPVITQAAASGWHAIVGGYVVRDPGLPELAGRYVYGDEVKGQIWSATLPSACDNAFTGLSVPHVSSFGEDASGRVYAASLDGPVYRLDTTGAAATSGCTAPGAGPSGGGPTTTTAPSSQAATPDRSAPVVQLRARRRQHTARRLRFTLTCSERCNVRIRAAALGKTAALLKSRTLAARSRAVLTLTVRRAVRRSIERRLRRGLTVRVNVRITVKDAAGNETGRPLTMRIRR